jgi:hypothetical protein
VRVSKIGHDTVQDEEREIEKGMSEGWTAGDVVKKKKRWREERTEERRCIRRWRRSKHLPKSEQKGYCRKEVLLL